MRVTLPDEVAAFLEERGPSTATAVALGIRARRLDVNLVLADGRFSRVPPPSGMSPHGKYFGLSQPVPAAPRGNSRAAAMLAVLRDGREHSRHEIFRRTGRFFMTNNAAHELRRQGYAVKQRRDGDTYIYWLEQQAAAA